MRRRRFIQAVAGAAAGLGGWTAPAHGQVSRVPGVLGSKNWTWVHGRPGRSAAEWGERFRRLWEAGIHGVLVSGEEPLPADVAREVGLAFHRWIWTLNRSGDEWVKSNHPEWFTVSRNGESSLEKPPYVSYYQWLCPTRPSVREYLQGAVRDIAADSRVDGVHLDYVRHADVILPVGLWSRYGLVQDREYPEFDFCYCEVCRSRFKDETGLDPMQLEDAPENVAWREFRWRTVTELVTGLAEVVRGEGKSISAAVFPTPRLARRLVRQAWDLWPLDAVFPMLYHSFYEERISWIGTATREGVAALSGTSLYSGLYLPSLSPEELGEATRVALRAGASGVSLFESGGLSDEHADRLREALSP